jgi:hypothetical protein
MTLRRHGAALLVASFLVAQLIALIHQSGAEHAVCPEHGELIHGRVVAGAWSGPAAEAHGSPAAPKDDHDVCELVIASHDRLQPAAAEAVADAPPAAARERLQSGRRLAPTLAVYRTAPKTSPPA